MKKKDNTLRRLMEDTYGIRRWILLGGLMGMAAVLCGVVAPEILGQMVQKLYDFGNGDRYVPVRQELVRGLLILALVYGLQSAFQYGRMYIMNWSISSHYTYNLRVRISDKLQRLPVKYVDQTPVGDVLERMVDDVSEMSSYVHQIIEVMLEGSFQILIVSLAMFRENGLLALMVLVLAPASTFLSSKIASVCGKYYDKAFTISGQLSEIVEESFTNFATTKAYNLEDHIWEKHAAVNRELAKTTARANFTGSIVQPLIKFANSLAYICINLIGGLLIVRQGVSVGSVVTIVLFARQFAAPLEQMANGFANINHVKACAKRVYEILDQEEEPVAEGSLPETPRGEVEFQNVCFSYDPRKPLIQDLNLKVKPGQKVAIVGPTGAGKTTIVNLLMRFYDLDSGRILLDGEDISQVRREAVRDRFGMVLQDTWLFRGTIRENLAYGKTDATQAEIEEACDQAYCHHFIRTMPDGYDTIISEDTTNLSGGQKQLLTIARALLADKPLLILDEATSNVDTRTEILIQKAMDRLMAGKTSFVIAHRLSTIVDADVILVLDQGKIVEQGTHEALLQKEGFYYRLFTSQYAL